MADYKIANIKWLRDRGWEISSSYADGLCPTYDEIVNKIPKGSITVGVSGTYSNNQLVCEKDITIGPAVDCSTYEFYDYEPSITHEAATAMLALSNYNKEQLSWTINDNWITSVTAGSYTPTPGVIFWAYGCNVEANPTTRERTGSVTFTSTDGCSFSVTCTQEGKAEEDETYTVYVTSDANEQSCAKVLIADGGSIEFTLSIYVGGTTHTLKYLVSNGQVFGEAPKRFGTINVPIGQISSFDFNCLSTNTGNILKAYSSSNGNKLPQLTTQWSTLGSNTELWEGGIIPDLCTSGDNGNRFVVSWDINTTTKTIAIYYRYQDIN